MSLEQIDRHYTARHTLRQGIFGAKPYSNYGYWPRPGMSIDEAGDAMAELVAEAARLGPGQRVLEVGCGYAASAVHYTARFGPAAVLGIDATAVRVEEARAYVRQSGLEARITVQVGDATRTGLADGSFDRVLAMECAFHFSTRRDFLAEAFRVLAGGGLLVITDIIQSPAASRAGVSLADMRALLGADQKQIMDENIYDADVYAAHLAAAGFVGVEIRSIKDRVVPPFADHLERVGLASEGERRRNRLAAAEHFRTQFMQGGDYVLIVAQKRSS